MARFQQLPDRTDCVTTTIPDQQMCQSYGMVLSCVFSLTAFNTKAQISVYGNTCCAFTVPTGVSSIVIEAWGGGGGGGAYYECCCCMQSGGGGAGSYIAATIPTTAGCVYTICTQSGGTAGVGNGAAGVSGGTSYVTGYNLSGFCARGGQGGCTWSCGGGGCCSYNQPNATSLACIGSSTYVGNVVMACGGQGGALARADGCRSPNKGGSAPMGGGIGGYGGYYTPCCSMGYSGGFPGGGGSGASTACCCGHCQCATCGGSGLVRIWY